MSPHMLSSYPAFESTSDSARLLSALAAAAEFRALSRLGRRLARPWRFLVAVAGEGLPVPLAVTARTFYGEPLRVVLPDPVCRELFLYGFFERGLTAALVRMLRPGDVFVDIGAHVGYFSRLAAHLVGPRGRVVAFEPTPRTCAVLQANLADIALATVEPAACWDEPGQAEITDFGWRRAPFNSLMGARYVTGPRARTRVVPLVALDDYCSQRNLRPRFVKIDAESAESRILAGMTRVLDGVGPTLSLEVGDFDGAGTTPSRELVDGLLRRGYRPFEVRDDDLVPHTPRDRYGYDNLIFRKNG